VTGYPWAAITTPEHKAFVDAYVSRYHETPNIGSIVGYINTQVLARALTEAGSTKTDDLIRAMEHLSLDTPVGKIAFRAIDHQSTLGVYIGRLAVKDGEGEMVDWRYVDGADFQPSDAVVAAKRKE
jgi:branched-chain amino acid transport system substrate-binding protein